MASTPSVSELEPLLASLNELKAPGANKSKIATITAICVKNIHDEQTIVQLFYRALKKAPATHKLGALYVIDSVIRQWTDKGKKTGENLRVEGRGEPGTYGAALRRVSELMPALLNDTMNAIPADQKPKLANLLDIWDRGAFFSNNVAAEYKAKLAQITSQAPPAAESSAPAEKFKTAVPTRPITTPVGYPPQRLYDNGLLSMQSGMKQQQSSQGAPAAPVQPSAQNVDSILAALAASAAPKPLVQQQTPVPQVSQYPQQPPAAALPGSTAAIPANIMAMLQNGGLSQPVQAPQYGIPASTSAFNQQPMPAMPSFPPMALPQFNQAPPASAPAPAPTQMQDPLAPLRPILPQNILNDPQKLMQALELLKELQSGGLPMNQWGPVIQAFSEQTSNQPSTTNGRGRSRSPERGNRGRGSPVYGAYDDTASRRQQGGDNHDQNRYRQRSPLRSNNAAPPASNGLAMNGNPMQPKIIHMDSSLPPNSIKVLSRTLFVGGANGSQQEIQQLFERFGKVQTCIANRDKRHAFVKMTTRQFALNAKAGMEHLQAVNDRDTMSIARQTKWGVGFGPRECCDYSQGESTIPINKLTDADVKWLLSAEFGGTGGRELIGGMVLEEPDIEIGAGVSSKAMSRRVGPDGGGAQGGGGGGGGGGRRGRDDRGGRRYHNDRDGAVTRGHDTQMSGMPMEAFSYPRPEPVAVATPPAVPGFGFSLPGGR